MDDLTRYREAACEADRERLGRADATARGLACRHDGLANARSRSTLDRVDSTSDLLATFPFIDVVPPSGKNSSGIRPIAA